MLVLPEQPAEALHSSECCYEIGNNYFFGEQGCGVDREVAFEWYHQAAVQGHIAAQYNLGLMYRFGQGIARNDDRAIYWYTKAADKGYELAMLALADMYYKSNSRDLERAYLIYAQLAEQGNAAALYNIGNMYASGDWVAKSPYMAESYFHRASQLGHIGANWKLERMAESFV
ncbi:sel1 repeat family protein [Deferribacterales bacterium RsTz2092]